MVSVTLSLKLVVSSVAIVLLFLAMATAALSNGETSPSYISVRALDHYGNAVQLTHAKEAAHRYGRSVVVAVVDIYEHKNSTDVQEELAARTSDEQQQQETREVVPSSSFLMVVSLGKSPVLHSIQLPLAAKEKDSSSMLAICFTGVKGDANWLLQQIQKYAAEVWERYDTTVMSAPVVAHVVARLLGRFAAQPEKEEWQSSLGLPGKHDREDDRQSSWSRPLGVQTMILSSSSSSSLALAPASSPSSQWLQEPGLLIVEPSGRILNPVARSKSGLVSLAAMGKESDKVQARLLRLLQQGEPQSKKYISPFSLSARRGDDPSSSSSSSWEELPPTFEKCRDTLIRVLLEEATNNNSNGGGDIIVESYSSDEGRIERSLYRYQNANTFAPVA